MATETDVYKLETKDAVQSLQELGRAYMELKKSTEEAQKHAESLADVFKHHVTESFLTAQAQFALLEKAFEGIKEFLVEGAEEWNAQANATLRLGVVLRNTGADVEKFTHRYEEQAKQLERNLGVEETHTLQLQAMLLQMGVGAGEVERFTEASVKLGIIMGQDSTTAARLLARAHAEGKEELKKYGIVLSNSATEASGFERILEEVERRTSGVDSAMTEYTRTVNQQTAAWGEFKKHVGGWLAGFWTALNRDTQKAADNFERMKKAMEEARWTELKGILNKAGLDTSGEMKIEAVDTGEINLKKEAADREKAYMERLKREGQAYGDERSLRDENEKENNEHTRKAIAESQKQMEEAEKDRYELEKAAGETTTKILDEDIKKKEQLFKELHDNMAKRDQEALAKNKKFWQDMQNNAMQYTQQIASTVVNFLGDMMMENTQYNRQLFELQVQRETAGMSETEAAQKRVEIEGKLREEKIASFEKELAASLMSVAKDAAIKALWEGASAVASFASDRYDQAEEHAIAAALYAGVAVAAGGGAYAINSTRGMTGDEKASLENQKKSKEERSAREARQKATSGEMQATTQVTVNYMGIAGTTELEQARELERIRKQYGALKTGGSQDSRGWKG